MTVIDLESLRLDHGAHESAEHGMCVMEAVSWVAGEPFSDHPKCASPVIAAFLRSWNDRMDDESRQILKPLIVRLVGTNTGLADEERRRWMIADWVVHEYAPAMFRAAGWTEQAEQFEQIAAITSLADWREARSLIWATREAAFGRRRAAIERVRADAAAVAVAAADAAAPAAADAAADAVAAAAAAAAAVAAAAAAAAAAAVAAAVAVADADAALREALAAAAAQTGYNAKWHAAYRVLRPYYDRVWREKLAPLDAGLRESALRLVDRLIEVGKTESVVTAP